MSHVVAFSCTHPLFSIYFYIFKLFWEFSKCFFLPPPPHSLIYVSASWHQNVNLLRPRTLCILGHLFLLIPPPLLFDSMMSKPERTSQRTFLDEAFIKNAKSFCQTSLTLTYPLSFTVEIGSHYVTSRSPIHPGWSRSFTLKCMGLIIQYLFLLLAFEVCA